MADHFRSGNPHIGTTAALCAIAGCAFYCLTGLAFVFLLGIQNDEALFASGIYEPIGLADSAVVFGRRVPTMLMSYLGALKSWLYGAVFWAWNPGPASIRAPMLAGGALSLVLLFFLLRRVSGPRAAAIGVVLLAADTSYLLTACFDWGPVVLQHLALIGGVLLLVRHAQQRGEPALAGGFLLLGLGMWDKALFSWSLAGLAVAALAAFPKEVARWYSGRRAAVALVAFVMGAFPLILYNARHPLATLRQNASYTAGDLPGKFTCLRLTMDGSLLFGWLVRNDPAPAAPAEPQTRLAKASQWVNRSLGEPRHNLQVQAFGLALLIFGWLWRREGLSAEVRVLLFTLVFMLITWLQMAVTRGAGGSAHHTVLLWPGPQVFMAVAFTGAARRLGRPGRAAAAVLVAAVAFSGMLVTNHYRVLAVRNGGGLNWTDAIYPLESWLRGHASGLVFITDWGMLDSLRLLSKGRLALRVGSDPRNAEELRQWVSNPENLFVSHTQGNEFFPGNYAKVRSEAEELGYRPALLEVLADRHGRPIFEVARFVRAEGP